MLRAFYKNIIAEVHLTGCIVSQSIRPLPSIGNAKRACALINPTNKELKGTAASYFAIGKEGETQQQGFNSRGGLDIGSGQLYATQVVDGRVCQFGGQSLVRELEKIPAKRENVKCEPGNVVRTLSTEQLTHNFKNIIHTVSPYPTDVDAHNVLQNCYVNALNLASELNYSIIVSPLIGNGQRGFDNETAIGAAIKGLERFGEQYEYDDTKSNNTMYLCFGLIEDSLLGEFEKAFERSNFKILSTT